MIDNPIYVSNGPVYDSILTQPQSIQIAGSEQMNNNNTCITNPHYESLHIRNSEMTLDTVLYIDQPNQPKRDLSNSCHSSSSTSLNGTESMRHKRSKSSSVSASGLKSNGQPRNKLGLTLSLGGSDRPREYPLEDIAPSKTQGNNLSVMHEEEAYAVMNSAGSLFCSFTTGSEKV